MGTISLQELQQNPEKLFDRVEAGESFLLLRGGRPVAELRPVVSGRRSPRPIGLCAGAFIVPDNFDDPLPDEILQSFEAR